MMNYLYFQPGQENFRPVGLVINMLRIMKLTLFLILFSIHAVFAVTSDAQNVVVSLNLKNQPIERVLTQIEEQTNYHFFYDNSLVNVDKLVSIDAVNEQLVSVLNRMFAGSDIRYRIVNTDVVLSVGEKQQAGNKKVVSGTVTDPSGEPVIGANVVEKGTVNGVMTDIDGHFELTVDPEAVLQISYVGYLPYEEKVSGKSSLRILLKEDMQKLDEVVVVGYGTQKKGNLTGSISSIQVKDITQTTHASLAQSLQGKVAGFQVRQQVGEPGDYNSMINIRGFGTPLYVIDGIVRDGSSEFNKINPNDIESISILKDASAAIYGLNAANGVVLVTTKKGVDGRPRFNYNGVVGWQTPTDVPAMASASQYVDLVNDAHINAGGDPYYSQEEVEKWHTGAPGYEGTDWYDETLKKAAFQQQHDFSVRGGSEQVKYFISFGYLGEEGLLKSNELHYDKYTVRSNLTAKLNTHLTLDVMLSGRYDKRECPGENFFWIFRGTRVNLPTESPYANHNPDYLNQTTFIDANPVAMSHKQNSGYTQDVNKFFQSSATLTYRIPFIQGLQLKGTVAYDSNDYMQKKLHKAYDVYIYTAETDKYEGKQVGNPSTISNTNQDNNRLVFQAQLNYNRTFCDAHHVGATLVFEENKTWYREGFLQREYQFYTNDQIDQAGLNNQSAKGTETETASRSYIGKFNYDYKSKYLIEFAFRQDGSYRYAPDHRWGFFPVVSGGWRMSEEAFIKNNFSFIDNLKIRASYGLVGENAGAPFQYIPGFSTTGGGGYEFTNGQYTTGASAPSIVNPNLTWFKSNIKDIGVDLGLFNGLLSMEFDLYQRDRKGLLAYRNLSLPNTFGGTLPEENLNSDRVKGFDFVVGHTHKTGDFTYGVSVNFNFARSMNKYVERAAYRSSNDRWRNGNTQRWNDILWGYRTVGQFQNEKDIRNAPIQNGNLGNIRELPGDFQYEDANGDGVIDGKDMLPVFWGGNPKLYYGINLSAQWKGFDFNALLQGSGKYSVRFQEVYSQILWSKANTPAYFYDRWHKADPYDPHSEWVAGKWPAARYAENMGAIYSESDVWRRDASYLRLKSVELGYTLPRKWVQRYWLENVRVYANAYNLLTFADSFVKPFDPEKIEGAFSAGLGYPLTKSFNIGINVSF